MVILINILHWNFILTLHSSKFDFTFCFTLYKMFVRFYSSISKKNCE